MPTKASYTRAIEKLKLIESLGTVDGRDVLDIMGRATATEMARLAVPYGTGQSSKELGENAVRRDIGRVYATPRRAWEDISGKRERGAFWYRLKQGDTAAAEDILNASGNELRGARLEKFDGGAEHRTLRNSRGRVPSRRPRIVVTDSKKLEAYVKTEVAKVGTAKGGFADIVRAIGGRIRGLKQRDDIGAGWITRHARGHGKAFHGGSKEHLTLTIRNTVPYSKDTLEGENLAIAQRVGRGRAIAGWLGIKAELLEKVPKN